METHIRPIPDSEIREALDLVWRVFEEFDAPDYYYPEGIEVFKQYIDYPSVMKRIKSGVIRFRGCYENDRLVGVICIRELVHISLLFVEKSHHYRGAARQLVLAVIDESKKELPSNTAITVNSSLFAVELFHSLGFTDTGSEQTMHGTPYIPMSLSV